MQDVVEHVSNSFFTVFRMDEWAKINSCVSLIYHFLFKFLFFPYLQVLFFFLFFFSKTRTRPLPLHTALVNLSLLWLQRNNQRWKWVFCNLHSITMQSDLMLIHSRSVISRRENLIWAQQEVCMWKLSACCKTQRGRGRQTHEWKHHNIIRWWCREIQWIFPWTGGGSVGHCR